MEAQPVCQKDKPQLFVVVRFCFFLFLTTADHLPNIHNNPNIYEGPNDRTTQAMSQLMKWQANQ